MKSNVLALTVGDKFKTNTSVPKDYNIEVTAIFNEHGQTYRAIIPSEISKEPVIFVAYKFYQVEDNKDIHIMLMKNLGEFMELIKGLEPYKEPTILDKVEEKLEEFAKATALKPKRIVVDENTFIQMEQTVKAITCGYLPKGLELQGYRDIPIMKVYSKEPVILVG